MKWPEIRLALPLSAVLLLVAFACDVDEPDKYTFGSRPPGGGAGEGGSDIAASGRGAGQTGGRNAGGSGATPSSGGTGLIAAGGAATGASAGSTSGGQDGSGGVTPSAGTGGTGGEPPCVGPCAGECTPGVAQCDGLQPQVCDENGDWKDLGTPCAAACQGGSCIACEEGSTQCNALQPQTCNPSGLWENTGVPCEFVCDASSGTCSGDCTPDAKQCDGLQPQLCDENGEWQDVGTACAVVCNGGSCTACEPGDEQCNGLQPQVCDADGKWGNDGPACDYVCNQANATCIGNCTPGAKRCDDLQPQVCDGTGTWKNEGSPCDYVCSAGSGTCSGSCVPDTKQCAGSQPQVCNANGVWQNWGNACGVCDPCSASTGTCVPNPGATCSDGNACTTGEKCQSNGACGGGTAVTCTGASECRTVGACVPATGCPAPVNRTGSCSTGNECKANETCSNGVCGGGTNLGNTEDCGTGNKYCDGAGGCKCRVKSPSNKLNNPGFDGSTGWTLNGATYTSSVDFDNCSGSGSLRLQSFTSTFKQCVTLSGAAGKTWYFGYRFKADAPTGEGTTTCSMNFLPSGNSCQPGDALGGGMTASRMYTNDDWLQASTNATAPSGTTTIMINCSAAASSGYFDQMYLTDTQSMARY